MQNVDSTTQKKSPKYSTVRELVFGISSDIYMFVGDMQADMIRTLQKEGYHSKDIIEALHLHGYSISSLSRILERHPEKEEK